MAFHIIRDSEGRISQIMDEKEYAEHNKFSGCLGFVIIIIFFILVCIYGKSDDKENQKETATEEVIVEETTPTVTTIFDKEKSENGTENSHSDDVAQESPAESVSAPTAPAVETTPVIEEYVIETETESGTEQEQKLSRKERRALRKAQKQAEKEERRRQNLEEQED